MTITSFAFLTFCFLTLIVYYIVPKRAQWVVLLFSSIIFYLIISVNGIFFVLLTASTIYLSARLMQSLSDQKKLYLKQNKQLLSKEQKTQYKEKIQRKRRIILVLTLLLNIGILCFFKYCHFAINSSNSILILFGFEPIEDNLNLIIPLGISFYTFQSIGYLVDVYWEYYSAEKNYFKALLFVSFFPQMTQGPISDFEQLSKELFSEHSFTYNNYSRGFQRMLWGFMKKMVIANILAPWVKDVFANYHSYIGLTAFIGIFMYSIQIYADFSGYMDIMCGYCEMLDIKLAENFQRPYFSKNVAEYWRRWHMTMGAWFKKYIYFPVAMSNWSRKLGKKTIGFGKHFSETFPATIALLITWTATGLWHGASWAYIVWGIVNGIFIILSLWLEPIYAFLREKLHINEANSLWRVFQVIRTYVLVSFIKVIPEVGTLSQGLGLIGRGFSEHTITSSFSTLFPFLAGENLLKIAIAIFMLILWIILSFLQRKKPIRNYFAKLPLWLRMAALLAIFFIIVVVGIPASKEGAFLYEAF